ncbi:MAG: hypothetical protein QXH12_06295, partial [Candidatus Caldarchaeum sp.]
MNERRATECFRRSKTFLAFLASVEGPFDKCLYPRALSLNPPSNSGDGLGSRLSSSDSILSQ